MHASPIGITQEHVNKAYSLLKTQVNSTAHSYRCIDLEVFREEEAMQQLDPTEIFETFITNERFYNCPSLFGAIHYVVPKGDGGVRNYHFLEPRLRLLYYALGYYILDLTWKGRQVVRNRQPKHGIHTSYGARISLKSPESSDIYYQEHFQSFNKRIRRALLKGVDQGIAALLHIDIQDFYGSLSHSVICRSISDQSLPKDQLKFRHDEATASSIRKLLLWIMGEPKGLPLSRQNIVSNFISHLVLAPVDSLARNYQLGNSSGMSFHRYVDDMFFVVPYESGASMEKVGTEMLRLATHFGEFIANELGLVLNPLKTRIEIAETEMEATEIIEKTRRTSFYEPPPEEGGETPQETLEKAIEVIVELKNDFKLKGKPLSFDSRADQTLKSCFRKDVTQYVDSGDAKMKLEDAFENWSPILTSKSVRVLIFLILKSPEALSNIISHVNRSLKTSPSIVELHLAEHLMVCEAYSGELNETLLGLKNRDDGPYAILLRRMIAGGAPERNEFLFIGTPEAEPPQPTLDQIREMALALREGKTNLAYNHLLNAFHDWCYELDPANLPRRRYKRNEVTDFLLSVVPYGLVVTAAELFDRRNINAISHPGTEGVEVQPVSAAEFDTYREKVNKISRNVLVSMRKIGVA
jgi:hypothetical protein